MYPIYVNLWLMLSRFNLDQKRLNFYEDIEKFNFEFNSVVSKTNKERFEYTATKPSVLINNDKTLKISLLKDKNEFTYILFANHSISLLPNELLIIHKATKEITSFNLYSLKE